jgi:hypothetical protein
MEPEDQEHQVVLVVELQRLMYMAAQEMMQQLILVVVAVEEIVVMPQVDQVELADLVL